MTIGEIIDKVIKYHAEALLRTDIRKPFAWALYKTWKWVDEKEKERAVLEDGNNT